MLCALAITTLRCFLTLASLPVLRKAWRTSSGRHRPRIWLADPDAAQEPEPEPEAEEDDGGITVDEDGVEWYEDEEGSWWYRDPGEPDWVLYEE